MPSTIIPAIEFLVGVPEELSNVSLRRNKSTGVRSVKMSFDSFNAITITNSFTKQSTGDLRLIDSEGEIAVAPSSVKFIFGGDEGDDLKQVNCTFEIEQENHWERFMRFMHRYAEANGMEFQQKS